MGQSSKLLDGNFFFAKENKYDYGESALYRFEIFFHSSLANLNSIGLRELSITRVFERDAISVAYYPSLGLEFKNPILPSIAGIDLYETFRYQKNFDLQYTRIIHDKYLINCKLSNYFEHFSRDDVEFVYADTLAYIYKKSLISKTLNWTLDFDVKWRFLKWSSIGIATDGLLSFDEKKIEKNYPRRLSKKLFDIYLNIYLTDKYKFAFEYGNLNDYYASFSWKNEFNDFTLEAMTRFSYYPGKNENIFYSLIGLKATYSDFTFYVSANRSLNSVKVFSLSELTEKGVGEIGFGKYDYNKIIAGVSLNIYPKSALKIEVNEFTSVDKIFSAYTDVYLTFPIAAAKIKNITKEKLELIPEIYLPELSGEFFLSQSVEVMPNEEKEIFFYYSFESPLKEDAYAKIGSLSARLRSRNSIFFEKTIPILILDKNSWDGKVANLKYFVLAEMSKMEGYGKKILNEYRDSISKVDSKLLKFYQAKILYDNIVNHISYVSDPRAITDRVQYPSETLLKKGGDCDDFSVLFAALFESVGIQCSFIDYIKENEPSHITIMFDTELEPAEYHMITTNEQKIFIKRNSYGKETIWIPLEVTETKNFDESWQTGSKTFYIEGIYNNGLKKGNVRIVDIGK